MTLERTRAASIRSQSNKRQREREREFFIEKNWDDKDWIKPSNCSFALPARWRGADDRLRCSVIVEGERRQRRRAYESMRELKEQRRKEGSQLNGGIEINTVRDRGSTREKMKAKRVTFLQLTQEQWQQWKIGVFYMRRSRMRRENEWEAELWMGVGLRDWLSIEISKKLHIIWPTPHGTH